MVEHPVVDEPTPSRDAHLRLLLLIEKHPEYSQRRLAEAMGVSLGKTHYLLMALLDKGMVKALRLTRTPSKLVYAVTPDGVKHRLQLTRQFLQRKEQEYLSLRTEIDQLRAALNAAGPAESSSSFGDSPR
jgi:EPS-associated MarR family transcriptional regulator